MWVLSPDALDWVLSPDALDWVLSPDTLDWVLLTTLYLGLVIFKTTFVTIPLNHAQAVTNEPILPQLICHQPPVVSGYRGGLKVSEGHLSSSFLVGRAWHSFPVGPGHK